MKRIEMVKGAVTTEPKGEKKIDLVFLTLTYERDDNGVEAIHVSDDKNCVKFTVPLSAIQGLCESGKAPDGIQDRIVGIIRKERVRQDSKWGEQNHEPAVWTGILGEEFGELCEAINETVLMGAHGEKGGFDNMIKEASHVAAVAVGFMECLFRNKRRWML